MIRNNCGVFFMRYAMFFTFVFLINLHFAFLQFRTAKLEMVNCLLLLILFYSFLREKNAIAFWLY